MIAASMPAGFFTETATVLFEQAPSLDAIAAVVPGQRRATRERSDVPWFPTGDVGRVIDTARNGRLMVDVVEAAWPDDMGDPEGDAMLFGAWTMGAFGRFTQPDALMRACQQAWGQRELAEQARAHGAFVRIRTTYVIGGGDDAPITPEGRSVFGELDAIWQAAAAVLALPGAIAYFDPTAERFATQKLLMSSMEAARARGEPPIELCLHPRLFQIGVGRLLMDSLGMERLALPDVEVILGAEIDPNDGAHFILDVSAHHLHRGSPLPDGDTIDGPGGRYRMDHGRIAAAPPERPVVRLAPV